MNKVYITGFSSLSSLGIGNEESASSLAEERPKIFFPDTKDKINKPYCTVNIKDSDKWTRCAVFTLELLKQIELFWIKYDKIPIFYSTSTGGIKETETIYTKLIKNSLKYPLLRQNFFYDVFEAIKSVYKDKIIGGYTFSTACSSAGHTLLHAYDLIKFGVIKRALIVGTDALSITTSIGFDSLKLISPAGTKPLTMERDGLTLGEGGGILFLETEPGSEPVAEVLGVYSNTDGYHLTAPHPEGLMQKECMEKAIEIANIPKNEIDYISAHGTGTPLNDEVEMKVIKSVFENPVTVSSLKSFIGHTLGSSALTEIAILLSSLKMNKIYQPNNMGTPMDENYIPKTTIDKKVNCFLKNAFGFGGNNVCAVIKMMRNKE